MKLLTLFFLVFAINTFAQNIADKKALYNLIDLYSQARERKDTFLLKQILTEDVDQLVSNGEWREGIREAIKGMLRSSETNTGTRKLIVDKVKFLDELNGVVDCRYEIKNADGTERKMWSSFIVLKRNNRWQIAGIRNMLPSK